MSKHDSISGDCMMLRQVSALRSAVIAFGIVLVSMAAGAAPQDAGSQIKSEIERAQQSLKDKPISNPGFPEINSRIDGLLNESSAALSSGWLFLALEKLGQAEDFLEGARTTVE